jgi:hypothetical protein
LFSPSSCNTTPFAVTSATRINFDCQSFPIRRNLIQMFDIGFCNWNNNCLNSSEDTFVDLVISVRGFGLPIMKNLMLDGMFIFYEIMVPFS